MPTYEYCCKRCGREWEAEQRITDPVLRVCPDGHDQVERLIPSRTGFALIGGGWAKDRYGSAGPRR